MDGSLYVLTRGTSAFISTLKNKQSHASYDLCHSCIGHVNNSFISSLNIKKGHLSLSSLLPSPYLCSTCQLAKSSRLPYLSSECRSSNILDLVRCDILGLFLVKSNSGFTYYVLFFENYSQFTWFYPLKLKSDFF